MLRLLLLATCTCAAWGAGLRSRLQVEGSIQNAAYAPSPSTERVVRMLENLITEMETEQATDDTQFQEFSKWCTEQMAATSASIGTLKGTIENLEASLSELYSEKSGLESEIAHLDGEINVVTSQMNQATERRNEEHTNFQREQGDFDNSITACNRAVELLAAHYGDGPQQAERPAWMSLVQVSAVIRRHGRFVPRKLQALLEQPYQSGNRYQESHGEAGNIVDQVRVLSETFAEDKQSSIDEEGRLKKLFDSLMAEKQELLTQLTTQRNERQSVLNGVNQQIGEQETAKANAEAELADEQAYLSQTKTGCEDTTKLYHMRTQDREAEKLAVNEAMKVLSGPAGAAAPAFVQRSAVSHRLRRAMRLPRCQTCSRAASLLSKAARALRSGVLATAAAATLSTSTTQSVEDVVSALQELIRRIDEDQAMEKSHKEWCQSEMSDTANKKATHEANVATLTQQIADETETVAEKVRAIADTHDAINTADSNFREAETLRQQEHASYETEMQNYRDAINALNQAMDIMAKFYAQQEAAPSFFQVQEQQEDLIAPRAVQPGVFNNVYQQKGGAGVVEMIGTVRNEFQSGQADLEASEKQAQEDFARLTSEYNASRNDLVNQLNRVTTEKQTAEANLDQFREDKAANEREVQAAASYLQQLSGSCDVLLEHYDERVRLRSEEKKAIQDAVEVLENQGANLPM